MSLILDIDHNVVLLKQHSWFGFCYPMKKCYLCVHNTKYAASAIFAATAIYAICTMPFLHPISLHKSRQCHLCIQYNANYAMSNLYNANCADNAIYATQLVLF